VGQVKIEMKAAGFQNSRILWKPRWI